MAELSPLAGVVHAQSQGIPRGIASACTAQTVVLQAVMEQALETGSGVLVESTSNQVNQEGGYTGVRPAEFAAFVLGLAAEAGLPGDRVVLGGDHLGPHPWRAEGATVAMERAVGRRFALAAWPGLDFFALYHPAYLLRSPGKRPLALGHLQRVREELRTEGRWPGSVARPRSAVV